jgi:putative RNA 2'-phosphotransferase
MENTNEKRFNLMKPKLKNRCSKFISLILRHSPTKFGIVLDEEGFCPISDLNMVLQNNPSFEWVRRSDIEQIVAECPKQRFEIVNDKIRARYGHSFMKIAYVAKQPPRYLLHGTHQSALPSILEQGILKMNRQYVHLSESEEFARIAGQRRGKLVLLTIDTEQALQGGIQFYYVGNEVWLSDDIPPNCISLYEGVQH